MTAAVNVLCAAVLEYGHKKGTVVCISSWSHAALKSEHRHMFLLTIEKDIAEHVGLRNGVLNRLE